MAFSSDEKPRSLEYPLYNEASQSGATPDGEEVAPFLWPASDPDERVLIALELSLNEYVALATSVDVGRDIAYNEDSFQIWWIWARAYRMLNFCAEVLECMQTNPGIQALLQSMIATGANEKGIPLTPEQMELALQNNAGECDLDTLWGSCLFAVQMLNRLNEDFFEQIEALTDNQEMLAYIVGAIPILETLPIDEFIELADKVREFVRETYQAGYDVDYEYALACGLFCAARANNCVLDMNTITEYFFTKAEAVEGFEDAFQTAKTIVSAMASWQEVLGEQIVDTMMAANVGFLSFLNSAFGMTFGEFQLKARSGIPDDDWQAFCDDCPYGACYTQSAAGAHLLSGVWVEDAAYGRFARASEAGGTASFEITFDSPKTLTNFSLYTQQLSPSVSGPSNRNAASVKIYLSGELVAQLYSFDRPNDWGYLWQPPGVAGIAESEAGAGSLFDRIVFEHRSYTMIGDVRGQVCVEEAAPASCDSCPSFEYADVSVGSTYNGTVWVPDDPRVSAEDQIMYGGAYIGITPVSGINEIFFNQANGVCYDRVQLYATLSGATGTMDVIVNGQPYSNSFSGTGPVTLTQVFDKPVPVTSIVFRWASGTGSAQVTLIKIAECSA